MFLSYEASLCDHIWSVSSLCRTRLHFPRHWQRHISHQPQRLLHGRVGDRLPPDARGKPHWPFVLHAELLLCILKANVDSDYTTSKTTRQPQPATTVSRTTTNIKYRSNWSLEADGQDEQKRKRILVLLWETCRAGLEVQSCAGQMCERHWTWENVWLWWDVSSCVLNHWVNKTSSDQNQQPSVLKHIFKYLGEDVLCKNTWNNFPQTGFLYFFIVLSVDKHNAELLTSW